MKKAMAFLLAVGMMATMVGCTQQDLVQDGAGGAGYDGTTAENTSASQEAESEPETTDTETVVPESVNETTVPETAQAEDTAQGESEEIYNFSVEERFSELPEGKSFDDMCGMMWYLDTPIYMPAVVDDILALNSDFYVNDLDLDNNSRVMVEQIRCYGERISLSVATDLCDGDAYSLSSGVDYRAIGVWENEEGTTRTTNFKLFGRIGLGDNISQVKELFGLPYSESRKYEIGTLVYYFMSDAEGEEDRQMEMHIEFNKDDDTITAISLFFPSQAALQG